MHAPSASRIVSQAPFLIGGIVTALAARGWFWYERSMTRQVKLGTEQTREGYDRWASGYDEHDNPLVAASAWALAQVPLDVAGKTVVELGCGTGRHAPVVIAAGAASYTGVDASPGMLARAMSRVDGERVHWIQAELARVPVAGTSFDVALIVLVLEHLAALGPLAAEVARLLAPAGQLRIVDIHPDLVETGTGAHFQDHGEEVWFTSVRHEVGATVAALEAAGLRVEACRELRAEHGLLTAVPRLAKHAGRHVLIDLEARRA